MKKVLVLLIITIIVITGCKNKEDNKLTGGWENYYKEYEVFLDENIINIFNDAKKDYSSREYELIDLLGSQVVAGTNYMFLVKGYDKDNESNYKYEVIIVYHDLNNKNTITKVSDFNLLKYVNENKDNSKKDIVGGWNVEIPGKINVLDESIQNAFDEATSKIKDITYFPITVLAKQIVSGTNYAILCYGRVDNNEGIYLITLYEDLNGNSEIISSSYVDLADYNK